MTRKRIALLVRTTNEWSRQILMGIGQFGNEVGGWDFTVPKADQMGEVFLPADWRGDGIICRLTSKKIRDQVLKTKVPAINVSWLGAHEPAIAKVVSDEAACAKKVANYFLERHFQHFAFLGPPPWLGYSQCIYQSIEAELQSKTISLSSFKFTSQAKHESQFLSELRKWLLSLGKPTALIAWTSELGRIASSLCVELGFPVPELVSILCVEHDDLASTLAPIPLSSLDQDAWQVGYAAAQLLDKMIEGKTPPDSPIVIPPISIIQRRSSESSAVDDTTVREAYRFIHESVNRGLNVDDVVRELGISRRTLEKKFSDYLKTSPATVIRRARLEVAKRLLRESTLSISQVAERSGFSHPEVLIRSFKRDTGQTPSQFRTLKM